VTELKLDFMVHSHYSFAAVYVLEILYINILLWEL